MKKVYPLFALLLFLSCGDIHYDAEKRLVFQTVVKNSNGEPLPDSTVEIITSSVYSSDLISTGKTNQNGEITLIFPSPQNSDIDINIKIYNDDTSYLPKELYKVGKDDFENYKFILQNANLLKLEETAPLQLTYNQVSSGYIVEKVSVNGVYFMDHEVYRNFSDTYYPPPYEILLKKNQAFQLKYTILNTQSDTRIETVVDLNIGTEPLTYTINY